MIAATDLRELARELLYASGSDPDDARVVSEALVWADLRGRHPQGVARLPMLVDRLERGLVRSPAPMKWERKAGAVELLDAADAFGHVSGCEAILRACDLAAKMGVGAVGVRNSNHFGAASWFCGLAAERGCAALAFTNAVPKVVPFGGRRPALGTN
ncbi:MAG: Ldh family oxidoreductase, partial [Candidatus Binatia bacterium]